MAFTMYSQRSELWQRVMLGQSSTTIGGYGCLICSVASGLTDAGVLIDGLPADPARLNRWLARNKGFSASSSAPRESNRFVFNSMSALGVKLVEYIDCRNKTAPVDKIQDALGKERHFVAIQVDFKPGTTGYEQHWVRAVEWVGVDVRVMDPWIIGSNQETYLMTQYALPPWDTPARAIFRIAIYRCDPVGPYAPEAAPETPIVQKELCPYQPPRVD